VKLPPLARQHFPTRRRTLIIHLSSSSRRALVVAQVSVEIERHERSRLAAELNASWETAARTLQERESLRAELASARPALQEARATAEAEATERERLALQLAHAKSRLYLLRANGPTSARSRRAPLVTDLAAALRALLNAPQQSPDDDKDVQEASSKCVDSHSLSPCGSWCSVCVGGWMRVRAGESM
jgi:septal ring factor EnvC (AmiA/AmiB activator)